ncbi:hypothetical protein GCM10009681_31080 [Luedemannella helvata]|uniref:Uncharacterized protein n=1 Tax=Luedemannella helvata TaxID=349315 RepID=A0ABP4WLJ8_9ACTN
MLGDDGVRVGGPRRGDHLVHRPFREEFLVADDEVEDSRGTAGHAAILARPRADTRDPDHDQ